MVDNDFPTVMANGGQFLSGYMQRKGLYQQSGTDIPEGSMRYVVEQQLGGPLKGEVEIAGSPYDVPEEIDSSSIDELIESTRRRNPGKSFGPRWEEIQRNMPQIRSRLGIKGA